MNKKIIGLLICILTAIIVIGVFQWRSSTYWGSDDAQNTFETIAEEENMDAYVNAVEDELSNTNSQKSYVPYLDKNGNLVIGNKDAKIEIHEYSSLTCPHCASFHKQTLPSLKTDYINTGKVKLILHDFPLNRQALAANLLLKCLEPQPRYELLELLFDQQEQWAFDSEFTDKLKQYAALIGIPNDKADECMNDTNQERNILISMKNASEKYNISSTPSFIILPNEKMISGAAAYGSFSTEIEKRLSQ
jgi:protein-disulfide isomerase